MVFDYEKMLQSKFRLLVKEVLQQVASSKKSLSGHHFYITFSTQHPKLDLPDYLREENPDEMTIVLQNQFWDLEITDQGLSVVLAFDGENYTIYIPFDSLIAFVDPYADFGLELAPIYFNDDSLGEEEFPPIALVEKEEGNVVMVDFSKKK